MAHKIIQQESVFDPLEQYHLSLGEFHYIILKKLNVMSFETFEFERLFIFFEAFMAYIPCNTRSTVEEYRCMKKFAEDKSIDFQLGEGVSTSRPYKYKFLLMASRGYDDRNSCHDAVWACFSRGQSYCPLKLTTSSNRPLGLKIAVDFGCSFLAWQG